MNECVNNTKTMLNNCMNKIGSCLILLAAVLILFACNKDDPAPEPDDREEITTLRYTLQSPNGGDPVVLSFQDLDGTGGNDPVVSGDTLRPNTVYFSNLEVLNEAVSPAQNITEEIEAEKDDHQFFFTINGLDLTATYADQDNNGLPVGLFTALRTGDASTGNLIISLVHKPDKFGTGVSEGQIGNAGGKIDVQANFPVIIE